LKLQVGGSVGGGADTLFWPPAARWKTPQRGIAQVPELPMMVAPGIGIGHCLARTTAAVVFLDGEVARTADYAVDGGGDRSTRIEPAAPAPRVMPRLALMVRAAPLLPRTARLLRVMARPRWRCRGSRQPEARRSAPADGRWSAIADGGVGKIQLTAADLGQGPNRRWRPPRYRCCPEDRRWWRQSGQRPRAVVKERRMEGCWHGKVTFAGVAPRLLLPAPSSPVPVNMAPASKVVLGATLRQCHLCRCQHLQFAGSFNHGPWALS